MNLRAGYALKGCCDPKDCYALEDRILLNFVSSHDNAQNLILCLTPQIVAPFSSVQQQS